jgi:hypothetical protein
MHMKLFRTLVGITLFFLPFAAWAQNNAEVLQHLVEKYNDLKAAYGDASTQYGPESPQAVRARDQLQQMQDMIHKAKKQAMIAGQTQPDLPPPPQVLQRRVITGGGAGNATYMTTGGPGEALGAWWKNSSIVSKLQISDEQVKKISQTFLDHKLKLIDLQADLEKQELRLEPLMDTDNPDEGKVGAQIDLITAARGRLEKENAMMMLAIRRWLSVEQWKKLKSLEATEEGRVMFWRTNPGVNMEGPPPPPLPEDLPVFKPR